MNAAGLFDRAAVEVIIVGQRTMPGALLPILHDRRTGPVQRITHGMNNFTCR